MSPVTTAPPALTVADARLRHEYLAEVLDVLYPAPCSLTGEGAGRVAEYLVIPHARKPKLLVPTGSARVAAAAVRRFAEPQGRLARLKREAVVAALRTGTWPALLRDRVRIHAPTSAADSIDSYLRTALGTQLSISVHIGPARANRKPVLQLLSPTGGTFGFAKLGTGPLTRRLVRAETAALTALSHIDLRGVSVPRVLHSGQWRGHQILVQSALPVWHPRAELPAGTLTAAMLEVARACGTTKGWLATSPYWADLRNRLGQLIHHPDGAQLNDAARQLVERCGDVGLTYGAWHGDWAPWNMAHVVQPGGETRLLVWDWERFTPGVPMGFDALHHELQRRVQHEPDARACVADLVAQAPTLLDPFDVVPDGRDVTALLYLIDLAARYVADRQAEAGARLGVLGTWLLPVLLERVRRLS
ncbi:hypothetical protein [Hamadaea tsunoensis]|uniref:hypothetical protein n=1 Tax=Hamadaea tsunoensis TaxID=53368 RepID=UPI00041A05F7|nr:hypothetical protein [Hamadaea tsunoensis]